MGTTHEVSHISSIYRETISDARLKAVTDHVRNWLFGPQSPTEVVLDTPNAG
jgi:hypothetical protein